MTYFWKVHLTTDDYSSEFDKEHDSILDAMEAGAKYKDAGIVKIRLYWQQPTIMPHRKLELELDGTMPPRSFFVDSCQCRACCPRVGELEDKIRDLEANKED